MTADRDAIRAALERMNRQQLALNDTADRGLWQDMTPYLDDMADAIALKRSVSAERVFKDNLEASVRYALNKWGPMTDARDELAELIRTSLNADSRLVDRGYVGENDVYDTADAVIAAGWSSPRDERMEQILDAMGAWDDE